MNYYDLTIPQQNIWNLQKYYEDTAISNLCGAVFFKEKRNGVLLQQAVRWFIQSQSSLRLRFCEKNEPKQYVSDQIDETIPFLKFSSQEEFDCYADKIAKEPLGLMERSMYRFVVFEIGSRSGILVVLSHLVSDAWTFGLMAHQVDAAYRKLEGTDVSLIEANYVDYIHSETAYLKSNRYEKDKKYWKEKYTSCPEKSPIKLCSVPVTPITAKRLTRTVPFDLEKKINTYGNTYSVTHAVLYEMALAIYLSKINPENQTITFGIPVLNRGNVHEKNIAGMFVSTLPFTVTLTPGMSTLEVAKRITKEHMNMFRHQKYPYSEILKNLRETQNLSGNLYDVMFSYQNAATNLEAETRWFSNGYSEVPFTMHIDNRDGRENHTVTVDYQTAIFPQEEEIELIIARLWNIMEQICENPETAIKDITMIPENEKHLVVEAFNDTYIEYPREKCVHELFIEQVRKTPDKIALVFEDRKFTYKELDEMSNSLAHFLRKKGVRKGDKVAILLNRDEKIVFAQLAVLRMGAVFIPIDSRYPKDRIDYIISESKSKLVVKNKGNKMTFANACNIEEWKRKIREEVIDVLSNEDDVCYIIFTSGSTGKPKGCTLMNKGIVNFCKNCNIIPCCNMLNRQNCVSVNTISFDFFIAETLMPLTNGYTVVLASEEQSINQSSFGLLVKENDVNIIQTTPTRFRLYFDEKGDISYAKKLQIIVSSGEALQLELLDKFERYTDAKIFNPLGPSECSIWAAGGELHSTKNTQTDITIGKPIANTQIYILDTNNNPLPIGVAGELCIAGAGVGKGYLNRPELTAEKFVPNPFATEQNHHGTVMYHTGDLARWRADGEIEYLGRIDTQVKIRGLRIELGEIESVMSSFAGIQLTAVADKRDESGKQYLVGYYTMAEGDMVDERELRQHLSAKLPRYMIPNYFMHLEQMPMTPSGKTDRKNLPLPEFIVETDRYVAPETEQEMKLCHLLEELLHMERVGAEDDFFELGGDSLGAIEYVARAHNIGIEIGLQNVFDYPTVRSLCSFLHAGKNENVQYRQLDFEKYAQILEQNVIDPKFIPVKQSLGNVFLTGVTGFLGAHVLDQLMREGTEKIYCLIRSNRADDGRDRLQKILQYYFDDKYADEIGKHIIPVVGNMEQEGMAEHMPSDVQTVIHTAASVKHYGSYSYFYKVNVEGTQHVIDYARTVGAKMIHISTVSVSGNSMADDFSGYRSEEEKHFCETSFYIGQPLDNVYIHSKFEAEKKVYDAMRGGLDAKVIRVGNLTNRASDYKFQPNYRENAFLTRVKAILEFGLFPDYLMDLYVEFSPIDRTAEGIIKIAQYADKQTVFHLNSNRVIYYKRFFEVVHELGISMKIVDGKTFHEELQKTLNNHVTEYIFEAFQNDMDASGRLIYDSNIHIENEFTLWFLKQTGFEWNETDLEYIRGYVEYFRRIGYLEV